MSGNSKKGKCIFCNGIGLTKQHVWPDWLKNVLPRDSNEHGQFITRFLTNEPQTIIIKPEILHRQGYQGSRKIRNVCGKCNGGWMSILEKEAKPILTSLIKNEKVILNKDAQTIISAWTVMTNIMMEFTDIKTAAIPPAHRKILMETQRPPEGWRIWIGWYRGEQWKQRFRHHGLSTLLREQLGKVKPEPNTQSTTFVMGELLIYAVSSTFLGYNIDFPINISKRLRCIWPIHEDDISWPTRAVLTDDDANFIADIAMHNAFESQFK